MKIGIVLFAFLAVVTFIAPSYGADTVNIYIHLIRDREDDLNEEFQDRLLEKFKNNDDVRFNVKFGTTRDDLINTGEIDDVDWIIYIGHGNSCSGEIASEIMMDKGKPVKKKDGTFEHNMISPYELKGVRNWQIVKGILIFGCAVIDIGDFGWQNVIGGGNDADNCERKCIEGEDDIENCEKKQWNERGISGNYCKNYFRTHFGNENSCSNYSGKYYGSDDFPE